MKYNITLEEINQIELEIGADSLEEALAVAPKMVASGEGAFTRISGPRVISFSEV